MSGWIIIIIGFVLCCSISPALLQGTTYDGNGCPVLEFSDIKVFGDSCYQFVMNKMRDYKDASKNCVDNGGTLATIKTKPTEDFIFKQLKTYRAITKPIHVWIGLDDLKKEGTFVWADGSPVSFKYFDHLSNLLVADSIKDCVAINTWTGKWDVRTCTWSLINISIYPYICEYSNRQSHMTTTTQATTRCPPVTSCDAICFDTGYKVDARGCRLCQCN